MLAVMKRVTPSDRDRAVRILSVLTGSLTAGAIAAAGVATALAKQETEHSQALKDQMKAEAKAALLAANPNSAAGSDTTKDVAGSATDPNATSPAPTTTPPATTPAAPTRASLRANSTSSPPAKKTTSQQKKATTSKPVATTNRSTPSTTTPAPVVTSTPS